MGLHGRGVDQHLSRRSPDPRERLEQIGPDTLLRPAHETIVERLLRPVDVPWRIRPAATGLQHMNDAADHPAIVDPLLAARIRRQVWRNLRKLRVTQPEMIHVLLHQEP